MIKIPHLETKEGIIIHVRVQPRSSKRGIEVMGDKIKVRLMSPPIENKANEELLEVIAEELGVKKSSITIAKGLSSRDKVLLIRRPS